jgi:hypothetical protein
MEKNILNAGRNGKNKRNPTHDSTMEAVSQSKISHTK